MGTHDVHDVYELTDDVLNDGTSVIGPIEVRFKGNWHRVEAALDGLEHGPVNYRWVADEEGLALYIEVPVPSDTPQDRLSDYRKRVLSAIGELDGNRPVYLHWQELEAAEAVDA